MTSTTLDEAAAAARFRDYAHYHKHLKIIHRDDRVTVPLKLRAAQCHVYNRMVAAEREGRPFRGIVLKARQLGISTLVQSFFAWSVFTKRGAFAITLAHEDPASTNLHRMLSLMYNELPDAMRPPKESDVQGKQLFLKHGSGISVRTAGSRESGRSFAPTLLHASEAAFYPDAERTMLAVRSPMQPKAGTVEVVESTPNGRVGEGEWFFHQVEAARAGDSEYEFFFFPWFDEPAYRMPAGDELRETLSDEETELVRRYRLDLEQLAWRRWNIANPCGGDVRKFRQENPSNPDEGFLVSGRPFFDAERVEAMPVLKPIREGYWRLPDNAYIGTYTTATRALWRDAEKPGDLRHARIWRLPHKDHRYAVAVDVAGQVESSEADAFAQVDEAEDYSVVTVVDRTTLEVVCQWRDRVDIGLVGFYAAIIGKVYGGSDAAALLAVEKTGGYGQVVLDTLKKLRYQGAQYHGEVFDEQARRMTRKLGWSTSITTRPKVLEGLVDVLRERPDLLRSEWLQSEMRTFIRGRRPEAAPGHHDDVVMSTAIALEVAREYPHILRSAA